tara:strand:- start:299 stop:484 length:186 start_codon:yes stop_codon:yes gene_type:complete
MPYHIKKPSVLKDGRDVYYTGENRWTDVFDNRKVYSEDPTAITANTDGSNGAFKNSTVVSE